MTYLEKLKDPRWQKKRLEILQRDNWTCRCCGAQDRTLHVHHFLYERGKEPWEVNSNHLITLCELCHENETEERSVCEHDLLEALREADFLWVDLVYLFENIPELQKLLVRLRKKQAKETVAWIEWLEKTGKMESLRESFSNRTGREN